MSTSRLRAVAIAVLNRFACASRKTIEGGGSAKSATTMGTRDIKHGRRRA